MHIEDSENGQKTIYKERMQFKQNLSSQEVKGFSLSTNTVGSHLIATHVAEMNRLMNCLQCNEVNGSLSDQKINQWVALPNNEKQFILDVFCWLKDEFSVEMFSQFLPQIHQTIKNNSSAALNLFNSYEFHLFIKAKYDFYPFEQEESNYPEDDNYFLSKDFSYVFHYRDNEKTADELEEILDTILQVVGSEYFISKLHISAADSFQLLSEEAYTAKNSRLASSGYPTYEDAIEWQVPLLHTELKKIRLKSLPHKESSSLQKITELQMVDSPSKNREYNLLKTLQAVFEFKKSHLNKLTDVSESLIKDSLQEVLYFIRLAKSYYKKDAIDITDDSKQLYRVGRSIFNENKKLVLELKSTLMKKDINWNFLGDTLGNIADDILFMNINQKLGNKNPYSISTQNGYEDAVNLISFFVKNTEMVCNYYLKIRNCTEGQNNFLNYVTGDINIEVLLVTTFLQGIMKQSDKTLLAIKTDELVELMRKWNMWDENIQRDKITTFFKELNIVDQAEDAEVFHQYIRYLINSEIQELDYASMNKDEFKHVGSVLLV